jgi:hypothetical protein
MKTPIKVSFLKTHHSKECFVRSHPNPWSGVIKGSFWATYSGNPNTTRGNYHLWYNVVCNDPNCPGVKAVHSSVLVNA